jgi:exopolysaccharide biosynthesis polyprenyl glycosylphosphotransferase
MSKHRPTLWRYIKPLADLALILLAFLVAYLVRYRLQWFLAVEWQYLVQFRVYIPSMLALAGVLLLILWMEGAYRLERGRALFDELVIVLRSTFSGIAVMIFVIFLAMPGYYSRLIFGYAGAVTLLLIGVSRAIERAVIVGRYKRGLGVRRSLIVSAGEVGHSVMRAVVARPELGYQIVGFVDDDAATSTSEIGRFRGLGTTADLPDILSQGGVDEVIVTLPWAAYRKIIQIIRQCDQADVSVRVVPDLFQMTLSRVVVENLDGIPLVGVSAPALRDWQRVLKRIMDVVVSMVGLVVFAPLFGALALAIKLDSPGPVIFAQNRVGRGRQEFTCYKFRSMCVDAEARLEELRQRNEATGPLFKMRNDPRRTRMGQFLRHTSLDELPQLWNVLRGEMSLIGPRPPIPSEVAVYEPWHYRRLEVAPGITGLWQVSGRSDLTFDEMVLLDVYYIENWSPMLDLRILIKTVPTVLFGSGAY